MTDDDRKRPGAKEILFKDNAARELKPRHVARRDHAPRGATGILIAGENGAPPRAADVPRAPRPGRGPGRGPDRDQGPERPVPPRPGRGVETRDRSPDERLPERPGRAPARDLDRTAEPRPGQTLDRERSPEERLPPRPGYGRAEERDLARERERERGRDMPRPLPP